MNIPKDIVTEAKQSLGIQAAEIIARGLNLKRWDSRNLKGCCPYHSEKTPSFIWNKKENYFKCFGCGITVDIIDYYTNELKLSFIDAVKELFKQTNIIFDFDEIEQYKSTPKRNKDNKPYKYPVEESDKLTDAEKYLCIRKISKKTMEYAGIKQDRSGNIAFEYKNQYGKLIMVKYRPSRKVKKGENKTWCQKEKDTAPLLYGMDKIDPTKPLLICEGEIDRLAAIESGFLNTVSVPFGANNYQWIEYNWDWLEQFEKIIIWSDNDEAGEKMRSEVTPRLGEYRCYTVQGKYKDINEQLYRDGKESVIQAIYKAKEVPISDIIDMADVEEFDINKVEKIKSGINGLDKWISGFVLGSLNVITGINGSGKSTFINQVCVCEPLNQGYKTFIFSGELTKPQLRSWMEFPLAGPENVKSIDNGPNSPTGYYVPKRIKEIMRERHRGKIFIYDNDYDFTATAILKKMEEMARKHGVKNFILDNLMMIDLECRETEKYTKQKDFILSLMKFAIRFHAVIHLVAHPRKIEVIRRLTKLDVCGSGDITNLAHYVTSIHRVTPSEKEDKYDKKDRLIEQGCEFDCIIDLFKNRHTGHQDKSIGVFYDIPSKRFYGKSDEFGRTKKYDWQKSDIPGFYEAGEAEYEECPF